LKGSFQMNLETDSSLGFTTVLDELYGSGFQYYQSFITRIDAVSAADVQRLANTYLDINKAAIVVARPEPEKIP
jgi:predicted Zn-dependent peptidase